MSFINWPLKQGVASFGMERRGGLNTRRKSFLRIGARGHIGREVIDANQEKIVEGILYAEDFEYRLSRDRFFK